jgi:hypothetical protein
MDGLQLLALFAAVAVVIVVILMTFIMDYWSEYRARPLLEAWLSPVQLEQLRTSGYFDVIGSDSGKIYRVRQGRLMNVDELGPSGIPLIHWCFLPEGHLPISDIMLAQKIALETDEKRTLTIAGRGFVSQRVA